MTDKRDPKDFWCDHCAGGNDRGEHTQDCRRPIKRDPSDVQLALDTFDKLNAQSDVPKMSWFLAAANLAAALRETLADLEKANAANSSMAFIKMSIESGKLLDAVTLARAERDQLRAKLDLAEGELTLARAVVRAAAQVSIEERLSGAQRLPSQTSLSRLQDALAAYDQQPTGGAG